MQSLVRTVLFIAFIVGQLSPLQARDTNPGISFFQRKKKDDATTPKTEKKPKVGLLDRLFKSKKKDASTTPSPASEAPKIIETPPARNLAITPPTPSPTPTTSTTSPAASSQEVDVSKAVKAIPLTPEEEAEIDKAVLNAPKATIVTDEEFVAYLKQQNNPTPEDPKALETKQELIANETLNDLEIEIEDEDPALSNGLMLAIASGMLGTTFLLLQGAYKLMNKMEARRKALAQTPHGLARAELAELDAKIADLRTKFSWMQNRLEDAGFNVRFSALGDIIKIKYQKVRRNSLGVLQAELAKNQNDLAFAMKAAEEARTELEYKVSKALRTKAQGLVAEVDAFLKENNKAEEALSKEQAAVLKAKKDEAVEAYNEYKKHTDTATSMETLRTNVIPYLNGGRKPSTSTVNRYLSTTNMSDYEKEAWTLLAEKEKIHTQAAAKVAQNKVKLVALEAHSKLAERIPKLASERLKQQLAEARSLNETLAKEEAAAKAEVTHVKERILGYKPAERLTRLETEAKTMANTQKERTRSLLAEVKTFEEDSPKILQANRDDNQTSARQVALDRAARIEGFVRAPEDHMTPTQRTRDEFIRRREAEANTQANERSLAAGEHFNENSAADIQRHTNNATIAQDALNSFVGNYDPKRLLETTPDLSNPITVSGRADLSEVVSFQLSQASKERREAMSRVVEEAIKEKSTVKLEAAIESDSLNAIAIQDILERKNQELSEKKLSINILSNEFRQDLAFVKSALDSIEGDVQRVASDVRAESETGPVWRGIPTFYEDDHLEVVASNIRKAHSVDQDDLYSVWRRGNQQELAALIKENPNAIVFINAKFKEWAADMREDKDNLSATQQELLKSADKENSAYMKKIKTRIADTKLSSKIFAEIWLIESLQVALGIPPRSNPAELYQAESTELRKATLNELMKKTEDNPSLNSKALAFVNHAIAYHDESSATDELLAKIALLKKVRSVLVPQANVHAMHALRTDKQISDNYDNRREELQRKLDTAQRELGVLEQHKNNGTLTEFQKATIDSQIEAQKEHIRLLEKNLASYTSEDPKVFVAAPGSRDIRIRNSSSPSSIPGFFKCKAALAQ